MAKINREVDRYISSYLVGSRTLWRICLPNGRGGQIRKQGFLERSDAAKYAGDKYLLVLKQEKGVVLSESKLSFSEYSRQWLIQKQRLGLSQATLMRYEQEIKLRLNPYFGSLKLKDLEKYHLRNFIADQHEERTTNYVIKVAVVLFKSIMKQAEADDLISPKGFSTISPPKAKAKPPRFWDQRQVRYFLNATVDNPNHLLWKLTLFTGMRAGEIAGLKWDAVHLDRSFGGYTGALVVKRTYNQKTREMQETTKNGDFRVIPLLPEAKEVLISLFSALENSNGFVFGGSEPLDSSHFNRQLQAALNKLSENQLPRISFHGLRHSFCSYLDSTGMSRRVVAEIMGHRDLNTTNRYSHVNNQMLGHEVQRWLYGQSQQKTNNFEAINF